ncbi:hypothetical protein F4781DRAFT_269312 [Annulohypoxylon bovei var. microspora]|nr:hypothetical protein F4781DRAFT_269312 [Annulohypoxylon bovei var. microspora]
MSHSLRPLLPNSPKPPRIEASSLGQHRAKRIATPAACEACRKRKSKCSAERPRCSVCVERQTACEYTTLPTETHLKAQKRKLTDLEIKCQEYEDLFGILRSRQDHETADILNRIRTGEDVQTIVQAVQDGDLLLQLSHTPEFRFRYEFPYIQDIPLRLNEWRNPYLQSTLYQKTVISSPLSPESLANIDHESQMMYLMPYHTVQLADSRISAISVASWTAISVDNPMLRALLQLYFIFDYPFNPYFHKDLFLDDMLVGSGRFCSPLLVNAILGAAWHGYSKVGNRAKYWLPDNLGYRFLAEARRLFELDQANPAITTVQAGAIIHLTCNTNGIDDISWHYIHKSLEIAQGLSLFSPSLDEAREWQVAAATTAWSLFNWQAFATFHTFRQPIVEDPPNRPLPDVDDISAWYGETWVRYPHSKEPVPILGGLLFREICQFRLIMNEIAKISFGHPNHPGPMLFDTALEFRSKLVACMHYHVLLISLFEPFLQMDYIGSETSPAQIVGHSKACFETLVRIYYLRHGFESLDSALIQFLHLLGFSALRDTSSVEKGSMEYETLRSTLMLCAKGLREQGRNCYVSEAVFRLFKQSVSEEDDLLLSGNTEMEEGHGPLDHMVQEVRSQWPIGSFSMTGDTEECTLTRFLNWYSQDKAQRGITALGPEASDVIPLYVIPRYPQCFGTSLPHR